MEGLTRTSHVAVALRRGGEDAGGRGVARVVGEVARLAAEGALHAVGQVGVAAVEDLAEQVGEELDDLAGTPCRRPRRRTRRCETGT